LPTQHAAQVLINHHLPPIEALELHHLSAAGGQREHLRVAAEDLADPGPGDVRAVKDYEAQGWDGADRVRNGCVIHIEHFQARRSAKKREHALVADVLAVRREECVAEAADLFEIEVREVGRRGHESGEGEIGQERAGGELEALEVGDAVREGFETGVGQAAAAA
ncbi:hypothetical protein V493_07627, partial [Pseudogymnoascus sp. VKM F-4281 (FW-2241)]